MMVQSNALSEEPLAGMTLALAKAFPSQVISLNQFPDWEIHLLLELKFRNLHLETYSSVNYSTHYVIKEVFCPTQ